MHTDAKPSLVYQDLFDQDNFAAREYVDKVTGQKGMTDGIKANDLIAKAEEGRVVVRADEIITVFGATIIGAIIKETETEVHVKNEQDEVLQIPKAQIRERKKGKKILRVIDVANVVQDRVDMADSEQAANAGDGVYIDPSERERMASAPEEQVEFQEQGITFPSASTGAPVGETFAVAPETVAAPVAPAAPSAPVSPSLESKK